MDVHINESDDELFNFFVSAAVLNYFQQEIPELPITPPLQDSSPFMMYDRSEVFNIDSNNDMDAITIVYGDEHTPLQNYFIRPSNNFALGISSAVMHYFIRKKLPSLPKWEDNTEIKRIEVELKDGYIRLYGNGTHHTSSCQPNVDFSYSVKILLYIDNQGNLRGRNEEPDINVDLGVFGEILQVLTPIISTVILSIVETIIEAVVIGEDGSNVDQYLNFSMNIKNMFSGNFGSFALEAEVPLVEVTRNGVFFHGNISMIES